MSKKEDLMGNFSKSVNRQQSTIAGRRSISSIGQAPSQVNTQANVEMSYDGNISNIELEKLFSAPDDWNKYSPIGEDGMEEMIVSITDNGLLQPIIVWEQDNDKYMILSGHNRKRAFEYLKDIDFNKYNKIPAIIKRKDDIDEWEAREIIVDTNYVQRRLNKAEMVFSVCTKYKYLKDMARKNKKRTNVIRQVAEDFNITERQITEYKALGDLIDQWLQLYSNGKINLKVAAKIARLEEDIQNYLYRKQDVKIIKKIYTELKSGMSFEDIDNLFAEYIEKVSKKPETIKIILDIPKEDRINFIQELDELKKKYNIA